MVPFAQGEQGLMNGFLVPIDASHDRTALATDSGPLSVHKRCSAPRSNMNSDEASYSNLCRDGPGQVQAQYSRVYSSTVVLILTGLMSSNRSKTKSYV